MPVQPNHNVETSKIFGDMFPKDNEDTFIADAISNRQAAEKLESLANTITDTEPVTRETLQGDFGETYHEKMAEKKQQILSAANDHMNLAGGLEAAASNIAATKANMNQVDYEFHDNMKHLQEWGVQAGVPQEKMVEERENLLNAAIDHVVSAVKTLDVSQTQVYTAVENGIPVKSSALIQLHPQSEVPDHVLPSAGGTGSSTGESVYETLAAKSTAEYKGSSSAGVGSYSPGETGSYTGNTDSMSGGALGAAASSSLLASLAGRGGATGVTGTHRSETEKSETSEFNNTEFDTPTTRTSASEGVDVGLNSLGSTLGVQGAARLSRDEDESSVQRSAGTTGLSAAETSTANSSTEKTTASAAGVTAPRASATSASTAGLSATTGASGTGAATGTAGMMPMGMMGGMSAAGARAGATGPSGTGMKNNAPIGDEEKAGKKLSAGYSPEGKSATELSDKITETKPTFDETDVPTHRSDLEIALENAHKVEVLADKDVATQELMVIAANTWKSIQATGWGGSVAVGAYADGKYVYSTEHMISYIPRSMHSVPGIIPLETVTSDEFKATNLLFAPDVRLFAADGTAGLGNLSAVAVVAATGSTDEASLVISREDAESIIRECPVTDGTVDRSSVTNGKQQAEIESDIESRFSTVDKEPRQALMDMFLAGKSHKDYAGLLRDAVVAEAHVAIEKERVLDLPYLMTAIEYIDQVA